MKKTFFACAAVSLVLSHCVYAEEFRDRGDTIAVDFPSGWARGKSDDPFVTLRLEKGEASLEFARQESELSDDQLRARVNENAESLRNKGLSVFGEVKQITLRGGRRLYYAAYSLLGSPACIAFFTYNGASYSVSALDITDGDFRRILSSLHKPVKKAAPLKKIQAANLHKEQKAQESYYGVGIFKDEAVQASTSAEAAVSVSPEEENWAQPVAAAEQRPSAIQRAADCAGLAAKSFFADMLKRAEDSSGPAYSVRKPLRLMFWAVLFAVWVLGSLVARAVASAYKNPKLPSPAAEVPPDFFFPFFVTKITTYREVEYNVLTRQKETLLASWPCGYEIYFAAAVYGCLIFHVLWSLFDFLGRGSLVPAVCSALPGGNWLVVVPEIVFAVPLTIGLLAYLSKKRVMCLYDAHSSLLMEAAKADTYCAIKNGAGREVARLVRTGGSKWDFVDAENTVLFSIQNDFPQITLLRKMFGNLGGVLRARYGLFVHNRRAGFVSPDPYSPDRFQIHMDYSFARLAPPVQILISLLYIVSREKDYAYPFPF